MALIKCKMCGGDLKITEGLTVAECEYCGSRQTIPSADNEKKMTLFTRAARLLRGCEFDKAAGLFESIVADFPEEAEAYWGLVLCKYGIEYVDDPATGKKVPTCHRSSFDSVLKDPNFEQACENTDATARKVYRDEARQIEELRRAIIEVSGREEPYDVFISYKETGENGQRTLDSVIAQDIYKELNREGYRVFFSRISLEDKLGMEYEPYIFAALNSAKVMLVVGTDYEHFNAVWVKNEWSRFLKLIVSGEKKVLIPVFKNMDAYDMPEEFNKLAAQDMGKLGAMQDLLRGVEKIIGVKKEELREEKRETVIVQQGGGPNVQAMIDRGNMALEDKNWEEANGFFNRALDMDAKCAEAYLGKLMAELHVKTHEELNNCSDPFDTSNNYKKALRFADDKLKTTLIGYIEHINTRNENARLEGIYERAKNAMSAASTEKAYEDAAHLFETISEYLDSAALVKECYEQATVEHERQAEIARKKTQARAKRNKKITSIIAVILCAFVAGTVLLKTVIIPNGEYNDAIALMDAGKYDEAIEAFDALDGYKDSINKIEMCNAAIIDSKYNDAVALMEAGKYDEAIDAFEALDGYKDSIDKIEMCNAAITDSKYNDAVALMEAGKIVEAYEALIALDGYKDSSEKADALYDKYKVENLSSAQVGDYIFFGKYEQDNDTSNGKEPIEWLVLDVKDGKALVISKYALDCKPYNTIYGGVTWESCTLRKWLNSEFFDSAFSEDEKNLIPKVMIIDDNNPEYGNSFHGKATLDKVFLLSIREANTYFSSDHARTCEPSDYAVSNGAWESENGNCRWWLRSPSMSKILAGYVGPDGGVIYEDEKYLINNTTGAVRPAMWIELGDSKQKDAIRGLNSNMTISAELEHSVGVKSDGTVVAVGKNDYGQCDVSDWTDIVSVSAGGFHTVGLKSDRTAVAVGSDNVRECNVSGWSEIVAISAGHGHTVGLKADGTVVATGSDHKGQCNVGDWTDIVAISAGYDHTIGVKSDGTVVACGDNDEGQCDVSAWTDIAAISAGSVHTVGLKADGTVVATGSNLRGQCRVDNWTDIIAVSAGRIYTVGLKADGTVVAVGDNSHGQCNVSDWTDIVAISAGGTNIAGYYTLGLKADGTVVAVGDYIAGLSDWTGIRVPEV